MKSGENQCNGIGMSQVYVCIEALELSSLDRYVRVSSPVILLKPPLLPAYETLVAHADCFLHYHAGVSGDLRSA